MKKTVLVTGASGFIGRHFCEAYSQKFNIVPVCLIDRKVEDLDLANVDAIVHLAGLAHQRKKVSAKRYFEVNAKLTATLAGAAKKAGVSHFVFMSSVAVYGYHGFLDAQPSLLDCESPCRPKDAYARSKFCAEKYLRRLECEEFRVCILRPPLVIGLAAPGNLALVRSYTRFFPVMPFKNLKNSRTVVSVETLSDQIAFVIASVLPGTFIPQDSQRLSSAEIFGVTQKSSNRLIDIAVPKWLIRVLSLVFPRSMASLFGTLVFEPDSLFLQWSHSSYCKKV